MHLVARQDFAEEQNLVARMVHQLRSDDPDEHYQILKTARRHFSSGGPRRVKHTLPPLAFSALQVLSLFHAVLLPAAMKTAIITLSTCLLPMPAHTLPPIAFSATSSPGLLSPCVSMPLTCTGTTGHSAPSCLLCNSGLPLPLPCLHAWYLRPFTPSLVSSTL